VLRGGRRGWGGYYPPTLGDNRSISGVGITITGWGNRVSDSG